MPETRHQANQSTAPALAGTAATSRPRATLDAGGESASTLSGSLERCMAGIEPGDVLQVISGDPRSRAQIPQWCRLMGHQLINVVEAEEETIYWIQKMPTGGPTPRSTALQFARADIDDGDAAAVTGVLGTGQFSSGHKVAEFEEQFARRLGIKHAIALNDGAAAVHVALGALGVRPGDEVILPTLSFAGNAAAVQHLGAKAVLVDVRADTLCVDPHSLEVAITPRTQAIIAVHLAGHAPAMDHLMDLARHHDIAVIEDAAHAFPASYHGQDLGTIGQFGVFNFDAAKNLLWGQGGMLVTQDDHWAEQARSMSIHGIRQLDREDRRRLWEYDITEPGFGYGMSDVVAALGLAQLRKIDRMWARRHAIAAHYSTAFSAYSEIQVPTVAPSVTHAWHLYLLRLHLERLSIGRNAVIDELSARGIEAAPYFTPVHRLAYYRRLHQGERIVYPVASREWGRIVSLPIHSSMKEGEEDEVVAAVIEILEAHRTR